MFKRGLFLALCWLSMCGIFAGCATTEKSPQDDSVDPINYRMAPTQLENRVDVELQADTRIENAPVETSSEGMDSNTESGIVAVASIPDGTASIDTPNTVEMPAIERVDDYRVGTDDLLDVRVFGVEELSQKVRVNSRGYISLPLIGEVEVAGLLPEEVEQVVAQKLAQDYLQDPVVNVFVEEYASQRVTIGGAVGKSGVYALRGPTSLLQAVAMAGGLAQLALTEVNVFREMPDGERKKMTFDLEEIQDGTIDDPPIQGGDYIIVEKSGARTFLRDSLFRDIADFFNPFRLIQ